MYHNEKEFDKKYGIRHDAIAEKFYIGDSQINIDGPDLVVQNKRYKGTPGLYELLFKKVPQNFTTADEKNYQQIIKKTNAFHRDYNPSKQVRGSKLEKYKKIVAPVAQQGRGIYMEDNNNKIDYKYWDDPNELCNRLRLLVASQQAGHTGHVNEINSIIEELKEANIIY